MLPHGFEQPTAAVLLIAGLLSCFAGHRFFRLVLGLYGFLLGAMIASSIVGAANTTGMLIGAMVGGVLGSVVMVFAWFAGVSLVGAGIGVFIAHELWRLVGSGDPSALLVIAAAVVGAVGALFVQRYVIILGTAFAGAWTLVLAASNAFPKGLVRGASKTEVWILYPTTSVASWVPFAWLALGIVGTIVQLRGRGGKRR